MTIEYFTNSGRSYAPKASIRKGGQIGLNNGAITRFKIEDKDAFLLGYDREQKIVYLKPVSEEEKGGKKIHIIYGNGSISAKSFLDFFEIPYDESNSYEIVKNENDLLCFTLNNIEKP